jgi:hypothetical protein
MPSPQSPGSPAEQDMDSATSGPQNGPSGVGGRLSSVLGAIARIALPAVSSGLEGASRGVGGKDGSRGSFGQGLSGGANAEADAQAQQSAIRFKSFDDSVRAAQLHNDDLRIQNMTQAQQDAHQAAEDTQRDYDDDHNIEYNPHPSDGDAVINTLTARSAADPAGASIAGGTYHSANGTTILEPSQSSTTQEGLTAKYNELHGILNLPALQPGSQYVSGKNLDLMQKALNGSDPGGKPLSKDALTGLLSTRDTQRQALVDAKATPFALKTFDDLTNVYQKDLDNHQAFEDKATASAAQAKAQGGIDAQLTPEGTALNARNQTNKIALQDNAASDKPAPAAKPQNLDGNGNPVWVPGVSADEKKKAELSENVVFNSNSIASTLARRPDLVGKVAGRFTSLDQMAGTNDPDITAIQQDMHNIAMANVGIHGMKANDAVHDVEKNILNNFKNGPQAIGGALQAGAKSVQTFIDNARPGTYKTHSNNGGAMRAMVPTVQGQ